MIKVIDNFIPEDEWNQIKAIVMLPHNAFPSVSYTHLTLPTNREV